MDNNTDERIDRLVERHEALAQTVELLAGHLSALTKNVDHIAADLADLTKNVGRISGDVDKILVMMVMQNERIKRLEDKSAA